MEKFYYKLLIIAALGLVTQKLQAQCPVVIESSSKTDACFGQNDGTLTVEVSGGTAPSYYYELQQFTGSGFTFIASDFVAATTYTFQNIAPGTNYRVLVLNGACTGIFTGLFNIDEGTEIVLDAGSVTLMGNTKCIGTPDGSIELNAAVSGGTGPYTYSFEGGAFDASTSFTDLSHGDYTITAQDALGCTQNFTLTVPDSRVDPIATVSPDPAEVCINTDLALNGNPAGGSGTFTTHSWTGDTGPLSATNVVNPTFNSAASGTFNLTYTVTDDNGCTATDVITVTVVDDPDLSLPVSAETSPICEGTGTNIRVDNSEIGHTYTLRDATNTVISGPIAGTGGTINLPTGNLTTTTTFNVLASNGLCADQQLTTTAEVTVVSPPDLTLAVTAEDDPICEITSTNILVDNTENGFIYQLRDNTNTPIGPTVLGNGGQISLPTGNIATTTEFNVTVDNGTCPAQQLNNTATVNIVNNPNLTLSVTPASATVCPGTGTDILVANSETGYSYQLRNDADDSNIGSVVAGTGGQISLSTGNLAVATTFNVLVSNGICLDQELTNTATVNLHTPPTSATLLGDATICSGSSADLSVTIVDGTAPYSFTLSDGTAITNYDSGDPIAVNPLTTTTYTITGNVTDANGCTVAGSGSVTVTVNDSPDVGLGVSAQAATICENTATNIIVANSQVGVDYQLRNDADDSLIGAIVAGTGGNINLPTGNLTADMTFNVLANNGTCPPVELTQTASVTVVKDPDVSLAVTAQATEVCQGSGTDIVVTASEVGYDYQLRNDTDDSLIGAIVAGTGGSINLPTGNLTADITFNVLVSNGVCADAQLTQMALVTVNLPPTSATLSGDVTICGGSSTNLSVTIVDGTAPYSFTLSDGTAITNYDSGDPIAVNPATTTTYTITGNVTDANGCTVAGSGSATVTVNDPPTLAELSGDNTICEGGTTNLIVTITDGTAPYTIELDNGIGVINNYNSGTPITTPALTTTTTYNMVGNVIDANGCTVAGSGSATITVVSAPDLTLAVVAETSPICEGTGTNIQVSTSEVGYNYTLRDAGNNIISGPIAGTGGTLNLPTGNLTTTTTFNVLASNGLCADQQLTATAEVTVVPPPDLTLVVSAQDPTICENTDTNILVDNSESGFIYQLRDATNTPIGATVLGTGGQISLPTGPIATTTEFNVTVDNSTCPAQQLTTTATVTIVNNPNLALAVTPVSATVCPGTGTDIMVATSEAGYTYQLRNDADDSTIGTAVSGTGGAIALATGNLAVATTFNVLVSNGICLDQELTNTATVNLHTPPSSATLSGDATICAGSSTNLSVAIADGTAPYSFTLSDGTAITNYNSGNFIAVNPATTTTYTITGNVTDANGCTVAGSGLATVTVEDSPDVTLGVSAQTATICENTATNIIVTGSQLGVDYQLRNDADDSLIGGVIAGTGGDISLPTGNLTADMTFNVLADNGTCPPVALTQTASVTVVGNPDVSLAVSAQDTEVCQGSGTNIVVATSEVGYTYQLRNDADDSTLGAAVSGTGAAINLATGNLTTTTTFNVLVSNGICADAQLTQTPTVTVNQGPTATSLSHDADICVGDDATLRVTITDGTGPFTIELDNGVGIINNYNSGDPIIVTPATTTTYNLVGNVVDVNSCLVAGAGSTTVNVNSVTADAGTDQSIPFSNSTTLSASGTSGGSGGYEFQWEPAASLVNPTAENPLTQSLTVTTDFTLTVTDLVTDCIDTDVVRVNVTGGPLTATISATPDEICVGETSQLEVIPSGGSGSYDITWDNAVLLDDNKSATPVATPTTTTIFEVTIDDLAGQVITESVEVRVNPLPTVDTQPIDQTVCEGQDATFSVAATGSSLTYQWQEDTGGGFADMTGETNISLTLTAVALAQSGNQYQAVITDANGCSVTSAIASLTVPNPQVTTQPTDETECAGQDATFSVAATGSGLTYQWQEDTGGGFADMASETNTSLTLTGVTLAQSGNQYQVVITDANGCSVTSDAATLTVTNAPDATFSYDATNYCAVGTVSPNVLPPTPGGNYSANLGLMINATTGEVDLTSGTPGTTYQITYLVGSVPCQDFHTELLTIDATGDPSFDYNGITTFCQTDPTDPVANVTGDMGGTFTASDPKLVIVSNGSNAGTIDLSASQPGNYDITYTTLGICSASNTLSVTITAPTVPILTYAASDFCQGSATMASPTSSVNGTFSSTAGLAINATTGVIDVDGSTAGSYTVTYTSSDACTSPSTFDVTILEEPDAVAGADGSSCTFDYQLNAVPANVGTGTWTTFIQPGGSSVSFDDPVSPTATATVDIAGAYTFRWEVTSGVCGTDFDEVEITFAEPFVVTREPAPVSVDAQCGGFFPGGSYGVDVTGGSGTYTYLWSGSDWSGNTVSEFDSHLNGPFGAGVPGGIYTLNINDGSCDTTIVAVIGNINLTTEGATPDVEVIASPSCGGGETGDIEVSVPAYTNTYRVRYYDSLGTQLYESAVFDAGATPTPETSKYSDSGDGLAAGTYYIEVEDVASNGFCRVGDTVTIAEIASPLAIDIDKTDPSCVGADDGSIDITVSGGVSPYSYIWFEAGGNLGIITEDIADLEAADKYQVQVTDAAGCVIVSPFIELTDPPLADGPNAYTVLTSISCNSFTAQWDEVPGASYEVDVAEDNLFASIVTGYDSVAVGVGTFTLDVTGPDIDAGTQYFYRVRAIDGGCMTGNSDNISVTTEDAPTTTTSAPAPTCDAFTANWNAVTGATGYEVDVAEDSLFTIGFSSVFEGTNSLNITGLTSGKDYFYRVRVITACGTSANSDTARVTTLGAPIATPTNVMADNATCAGFEISWNAVTGVTSYRVEADDPLVAGVEESQVVPAGTLSYTFSGLTSGITYDYSITPIGTCSDGPAATGTFGTRSAPTAPTGVIASNPVCNGFTLSWDAVTDAEEYVIEVSNDGFVTTTTQTVLDPIVTVDVTGLLQGNTYDYRIIARNACGDSAPSTVGSFDTDDSPVVPTGLALQSAGCNELTFTWGAIGNANQYTVELFDDVMASLGTQDVGVNEITFNTLTRNTTYSVQVLATNDCGSSAYSSMISATTADVPGALINAPTADNATCTGFDVSWDAVATATSYRVEVALDAGFTTITDMLTVAGTDTTFTTLSEETAYFYRVTTVNDCGDGGTLAGASTMSTSLSVLCGCGFDQASFNVVPTDASCVGANDGHIQVFTETSSIAPPSRFRFHYRSLDDPTIVSPWDSTLVSLTGIGFVVFDPDTVPAGNYEVIIEDRNAQVGCKVRDTVEVQIGVRNEIEVSVQAETCTSLGAISLEIPNGCIDPTSAEYLIYRTNDDGLEEPYFDYTREPIDGTTFVDMIAGSYQVVLVNFDNTAGSFDTLTRVRTVIPNNCSFVGGDTLQTTCSLDGKIVVPGTTLTECGASAGTLPLSVEGGETENFVFSIESSNGIFRTETAQGSVTFEDVPTGRYVYTVVSEDGSASCSGVARVGDNGIVFNATPELPACDDPTQLADLIVTVDTLFSEASAPYDVYAVFGSDTLSSAVIDLGETTATLADLPTGEEYTVTVAPRAESSCPKTEIVQIPGTGEAALDFEYSAQSITCFGELGSVTVNNISAVDGLSIKLLLYQVDQDEAVDEALFNRLPVSYTFAQLAPGDYQVELEQQQADCDRVSSVRSETFRIEGPTAPLEADVAEEVLATVEYPYGDIEIKDIRGGGAPYEVRIALDPQGNTQDWIEIVNDNPAINPYEYVFADQALGDYQVEIKDRFGCITSFTVSINYTAELYIPNIFTPNGDGDNDTFHVINLDRYTSDDDKAKIIITSRWGTIVYQSDEYTEENFWDGGTYPDGIYFYQLILPSGDKHSGWVEIWRGRTP